MANKRADGEGTVRKRPDGRWEGAIVVGHKQDGSTIRKSVFAKTQKELLPKLRRLADSYRGAELTEASNMTVKEWLDEWMRDYVSFRLRPSTAEGYRRICEIICRYIGDKPLRTVTSADCQRMYNALKKSGRTARRERFGDGLSDSYVRKIHMMLHEAMEHAKRKHLVGVNPTVGTVVPKQNGAEMKVLNESQMENYLEAIRSDPFWYDFFYLELTTGLRLGELCALCWKDFDPKPGTLRITRTLGGSGEVIAVGDPKTEAGKRLIYLPASTKEMLTERMKNRYSQWIFPGLDRPERPVSKSSAYHRHKRFLKDAGLPNIRFHDLRHTFATHAMRSGVDAKTLSGILGHTNASFTLDTYTHVTGEMQRRAADIVGGFMEEIFGKELKPWQTDGKKEKEV